MNPLLSRVLSLTDHLRLSTSSNGKAGWYKEWHHFCIVGQELKALVNLNISHEWRPEVGEPVQQARLILLVNDGSWDGDVCNIPARDVVLNRGQIGLRFGHNSLRFVDGCYEISAALENRPLTVSLRLEPLAFPLLRSKATLGQGTIDWLVVPRLAASGTIVVGRRVYKLENAPAYHDHNWGHWLWGQDFAWQWGFVLPAEMDQAWSIVFDRVTNRARNQVQELKLSVWHEDKLQRIFAHSDIQVRERGYLYPDRVPKYPRIMGLITPESTPDVPCTLEIEAASGDDRVRCLFQAQDVGQIVVPNETDLEMTVINEVSGLIEGEGVVKGKSFSVNGQGLFEFLT
jgi:hypothetical protein